MKAISSRFSITYKLVLLLLLFFLTFWGNLAYIFINIQEMNNISENIVSNNSALGSKLKVLIDSLIEMDANAKKYSVVKKDTYKEYFHSALVDFQATLNDVDKITSLEADEATLIIKTIIGEYEEHLANFRMLADSESKEIYWLDEATMNKWIDQFIIIRNFNQNKIENALIQIHQQTILSKRNSIIVFACSWLIAILGVVLLSRSIIQPLKKLTHGLHSLSKGQHHKEIIINSNDEFHDLALAFNEMNGELREQENLRADFIATLSHELRTPLSSIKESINIIAEEVLGKVNEKQHKFLTIASTELTRIAELLNHLMRVSILETKVDKGKHEPVAIQPILLDCIDALYSTAKSKNISLKYFFPEKDSTVMGYSEELGQVFLNIAGNAIKFSPTDRDVLFYIKEASTQGYIQIDIEDEGPGIPDTEAKLIFKKYYRSKAVRNHQNGVGLGLYISHKLVSDIGGEIRVENKKESGCIFSIILPIYS